MPALAISHWWSINDAYCIIIFITPQPFSYFSIISQIDFSHRPDIHFSHFRLTPYIATLELSLSSNFHTRCQLIFAFQLAFITPFHFRLLILILISMRLTLRLLITSLASRRFFSRHVFSLMPSLQAAFSPLHYFIRHFHYYFAFAMLNYAGYFHFPLCHWADIFEIFT